MVDKMRDLETKFKTMNKAKDLAQYLKTLEAEMAWAQVEEVEKVCLLVLDQTRQ